MDVAHPPVFRLFGLVLAGLEPGRPRRPKRNHGRSRLRQGEHGEEECEEKTAATGLHREGADGSASEDGARHSGVRYAAAQPLRGKARSLCSKAPRAPARFRAPQSCLTLVGPLQPRGQPGPRHWRHHPPRHPGHRASHVGHHPPVADPAKRPGPDAPGPGSFAVKEPRTSGLATRGAGSGLTVPRLPPVTAMPRYPARSSCGPSLSDFRSSFLI